MSSRHHFVFPISQVCRQWKIGKHVNIQWCSVEYDFNQHINADLCIHKVRYSYNITLQLLSITTGHL